ncbi:GlsB/YeaQ/YmgE family stress response membrane protein [Streptacidiphilus anmyonensis]|uniref:GlsB/YeaQ/YmgE family stress response membrane protein n=1 Tax=Streptacidiphilus anmyonensis TaxID=405782 RepID=UPI0005AA8A88|nr:GlsB/YeaQ/YmgE family stress response membrane protein [Streptacidiphilus anmyonensis]
MAAYVIYLIVIGLVAGAVARLVVPGRDPIGVLGTIVLGVVGSFLGGFLGDEFQLHHWSHTFHASGILWSILGAVIVLVIARLTTHGRA